MGALLDSGPEGFSTALGAQQVSWTCCVGQWVECSKGLYKELGFGFRHPGFEGRLDSLAF